MADQKITLVDGKVHVYRRANSRFWQCATYLSGYNHRVSTKHENLHLAQAFARDWYMDLYAEDRLRRRGAAAEAGGGEDAVVGAKVSPPSRVSGPTFRQAAEVFLAEFPVMTLGERNEKYVDGKALQLRVHLLPFFGDKPIKRVTAGLIQEYRVHRMTSRLDRDGKPMRPSRSTLHKEIVVLRQVLKTANRKGWIEALPDMSTPYMTSGKVTHRAWFSPEEYKLLYEATRARAKSPKSERWRGECETFHDYVLFMVNTGLRPDEASRLQFRDVSVVVDEATGQRILEIEVRGKRGVGYCKSMTGAVLPFQRVMKRNAGQPTDLVFGRVQRELLNAVLGELGLKHDRDGALRTAYSLRHTYICMRLMEGADIYQIAKNCRTSVEMIERFYAAHIKNRLDAAAINVRKPKPAKRPAREGRAAHAA
ncbi:site-specific integrase [Phenylobacterium sp. LH3H17]|uniref:tyrosine-type recombinase/integrase n=1 Tax=Phenylobacterium sp. LH3H17 TaxID=2903901 RepID=UPI0020C98BFF|nr:site-specific integrase [Phenylobacterium sp. LH3H17]UTP40894.1 site-specific integrase [Phenylobacterium sp. LH3H17]